MEKFESYGTMPTNWQDEILTHIIEEAAEVIQRATKMQRFGIDEVQKGQGLDNLERLSQEIGNLFYMITVAKQYGLVSQEDMNIGVNEKARKLPIYSKHAPEDL